MSGVRVGLIDYGMGNLHSVAKAIASQGGRVTVSDDPKRLAGSDLVVLPGVGSFGAAMRNLSRNRLDAFARNWIAEGRPYLGICLGYQLLFERSEEDRNARGLGVLKGKVTRFPARKLAARSMKIPHMGWNTLERRSVPARRYFKGMPKVPYFYFVHSYFPEPRDRAIIAATARYGVDFSAAVATDRLFACQFHPEKSGANGLALLKNVVASAEAS